MTANASEVTLHVLDTLFGDNLNTGSSNIAVRLWDGQTWGSPSPAVTLVLNHPGALRAFLLEGSDIGMAEAYLYNDVDIQGDVENLFVLADGVFQKFGLLAKLGVARDLSRLPKGPAGRKTGRGPARLTGHLHSLARDREAVRYHYDVSNDFFSLYLDQRMVYSCACFAHPDDSLDQAQEAKLDLICRKLRLRPGQKLLDIGCGWGGLILYAAQKYGVDATGITLSQRQAELARERIHAAGFEDRCRVIMRDYREMDDLGPFDAIASVEMFEQVGDKLLHEYFTHAYRVICPGGLFLNQGISLSAVDPLRFDSHTKESKPAHKPNLGDNFMNVYVFPDGINVPEYATLQAAEETGWEVRHVESLREHYVQTLRHWVRRLEANHERALSFVDEVTYRVWRVYMAGCAYMFRTGRLNLHHTLLTRPYPDGSSSFAL